MNNLLVCSLLVAMALGSPAMSVAPEAPAGSARAALLAEMANRPRDPWPRGLGHVVLATPGSTEDWKGYHEPGGSFSPGFATFGVSIWVVDREGRLVTTSDTLPLRDLTQKWVWPSQTGWPPPPALPGIETRTPYYNASWRLLGEGRYQLYLRSFLSHPVWIMVRSAGPAGGTLRTLNWTGGKLYVNDRWTLSPKGPGVQVDVANPAGPDPAAVRPAKPFWPAEQPSGYARIQLLPGQEYWIDVEAVERPPENLLPPGPGRSGLRLELPDPRFADCLEAQVAQLLMGLVRDETRPGDPNNYPLNWLRDGAYTIVALARAGRADVAATLCRPFAQEDFFGGFGAEADAPGLALWALEEVASRFEDPTFDGSLWPHVTRKAALIGEMLSATGPVRRPFAGPVVPVHAGKPDLDLVCDAARDGLIQGRMDWHRPVLFVNAVSYAGLNSAAQLAARRGHANEASRWRAQADALRLAWNKALQSPEAANERTAICGLHPAWVVENRAAYRQVLAGRRAQTHGPDDRLQRPPLWTYFNLAEAHQWLILGEARRTWNDLEWFWSNEASPGLFTWWEGQGEENSFGRWPNARGWVQPPHVTPHYWTAAEMVLLQLDMLVLLDESGPAPRLVIGAGVPPEWLSQRLRVDGLVTRLGRVGWEWRRGRLTVRYAGPPLDIVPGPVFPADTELRLR
jgi:hypothetical protein